MGLEAIAVRLETVAIGLEAIAISLGYWVGECWRPLLLGWRPSLLGWGPSLLGLRPLLLGRAQIRPGTQFSSTKERHKHTHTHTHTSSFFCSSNLDSDSSMACSRFSNKASCSRAACSRSASSCFCSSNLTIAHSEWPDLPRRKGIHNTGTKRKRSLNKMWKLLVKTTVHFGICGCRGLPHLQGFLPFGALLLSTL